MLGEIAPDSKHLGPQPDRLEHPDAHGRHDDNVQDRLDASFAEDPDRGAAGPGAA